MQEDLTRHTHSIVAVKQNIVFKRSLILNMSDINLSPVKKGDTFSVKVVEQAAQHSSYLKLLSLLYVYLYLHHMNNPRIFIIVF